MDDRAPSSRDGGVAPLLRAGHVAFFTCVGLGAVEYLVTLCAARTTVGGLTALKFAALDATLMGFAWLVLTPLGWALGSAGRVVSGFSIPHLRVVGFGAGIAIGIWVLWSTLLSTRIVGPTPGANLAQIPNTTLLVNLIPWRLLLAGVLLAAFTALGRRIVTHGASPISRLWRWSRAASWAFAGGYLLLGALTLWKVGADPLAKSLAVTASPPLALLVRLVRAVTDFDGDGYGSLLGENDCAPFDATIHPNAHDIPDNGVDENCSGHDATIRVAPSRELGERLPLPNDYRRDWNFLLITIDTVRYDHTGFGGYKERSGRDTTPALDAFVERSVNFDFANAPSAGTMASVPAILTSRFFHSGIALEEQRNPDAPPKLKAENTTLLEVMKRGGYFTGAILTHEYFNDWGMDQGADTYDNSLGKMPNPFRTSAAELTDKAEAWLSARRERFFLWLHYIDPHGRYVPHPGERSFGDDEEALYDGEIYFTDKQIGRLLEFLDQSKLGGRTIVVVTSDHGDGFNEHGFINHGMTLYYELLRVPLIFHVPDLEPRRVAGAVSPLDIMPTLAELASIDISDLSIEGRSLVPELFYGRDSKERVVFAETNWPDPLRAAVSRGYKIILNLKSNTYQLFDLRNDPREQNDVWTKETAAGKWMKDVLDEWLDRVYFSRDGTSQAQQQRSTVLLRTAPKPETHVDALAGRAIEVLGWDVDGGPHVPGGDVALTVYFHTASVTDQSWRIEVSLDGTQSKQVKLPADGTFPTNRWRAGEYERETFRLHIPPEVRGGAVVPILRWLSEGDRVVPVQGPSTLGGERVTLGPIPLAAP
jgi:arylsulfatase A-like enzyme